MSDIITMEMIKSMIILNCLCGEFGNTLVAWKEGRQIVRCEKCGLWRILAIPDNYNDTYKSGWYHNEYQKKIGHVPYKERYWHDFDLGLKRLEKISEYRIDGNKLLDVGCSNGAFVEAARMKRYYAWGIDICEQFSSDWCNVGIIDDERDELFNIVTMYDVLEHYIDPINAIKQVHRVLGEHGLFVLEGPDFGCKEFLELGDKEAVNWKHVRPIEHLYMMPASRITEELGKVGFKILKVEHPIIGHYAIYAEKWGGEMI